MIAWWISMAPHIGHQMVFGAIAAVGFGVLFNFDRDSLVRAALLGAFALMIRTILQDLGGSLEASTFTAALATASAVYLGGPQHGRAPHALAIAGAIAMVPGAFFITALTGFLTLTSQVPDNANEVMLHSMWSMLRVIFTLCAMGTGLTIPSQFARYRGF